MSGVTESFEVKWAHWLVGGVLSALLGLVVLIWPGPVAITDRLPFALLLLVPGAFALYHVYSESRSPV
jgi:uncharacterized membrane protein HdeD (DUF308 family)